MGLRFGNLEYVKWEDKHFSNEAIIHFTKELRFMGCFVFRKFPTQFHQLILPSAN